MSKNAYDDAKHTEFTDGIVAHALRDDCDEMTRRLLTEHERRDWGGRNIDSA